MVSKTLSGRPLQLHGFLAALLSVWGVLAFWVLYGLVHAVLRINVSRTLALDDARASELVQTFSLGYQARQPPLYEWLLWCSQQVFGTGIASHLFVRYSLIVVLGLACFGAVRAAVKDDRWAAIASLSLAASYPVGWTFHEWATQTILLSIACFATLHAALNWLEKPSLRTANWLGFAIGLGLLAKFSYPLYLGGLLIDCLSLRETRERLADPRLLLSLAIAALMISPYALWLFAVRGNVAAAIASTMILTEKPYAMRVTIGLAQLGKSIPLFLLPWLAFLFLLAPQAFLGSSKHSPTPSIPERLVLRTMIAAAALAVIGIFAIGATNIAERYMHPILMIAPVYIFARIVRIGARTDQLPRFAVFMLATAVVILGVRILAFSDNGLTKRADRLAFVPFEPLAAVLEKRGINEGTVVTFDVREAGNLRAFLPGLRVVAADSFRIQQVPRRPGDERSCVAVYSETQNDQRKTSRIGLLTPERIEVASPPSKLGAPRRGVWFLAKLDPKSPACQ